MGVVTLEQLRQRVRELADLESDTQFVDDAELDGHINRELLLAVQPVAQRFPFDERHREPEPVGRLATVVHREDVGVLQPGGEADLALEPFRPQGVTQVRMEHLEGDGPVVAEVVREVHRGHAAAAKLALDGIARGETCFELRPEIGRELNAAVMRCLAKNPKDRYADAGALLADLETINVASAQAA